MKYYLSLLVAILMSISCVGCGGNDVVKRVLAISTQDLETTSHKYTNEVDLSVVATTEQVRMYLKSIKAYIYQDNAKKQYIVAMHFHKSYPYYCIDTTEVGFFFTELEQGQTQIVVSSMNKELARYTAKELHEKLIGKY